MLLSLLSQHARAHFVRCCSVRFLSLSLSVGLSFSLSVCLQPCSWLATALRTVRTTGSSRSAFILSLTLALSLFSRPFSFSCGCLACFRIANASFSFFLLFFFVRSLSPAAPGPPTGVTRATSRWHATAETTAVSRYASLFCVVFLLSARSCGFSHTLCARIICLAVSPLCPFLSLFSFSHYFFFCAVFSHSLCCRLTPCTPLCKSDCPHALALLDAFCTINPTDPLHLV